ncbi:MAG: heat shock protein DnaJ-like protein [Hyphomicrobiales bacterium]|nr:heat shock protein DnaJ-like protein [Hyphomicrobiales bacterium]
MGGSWTEKNQITVADALSRLQKELDSIRAGYVVVSSNLETRLDGLPRSGQKEPADPGVAVYFRIADKPHCLPCDTYRRVADNIAAIAAHIQATRAIERHGVASVAEMFSGFVALPAPKTCWEILGVQPRSSRAEIERAFRGRATEAHPDKPGGSHDAMARLNRARDDALQGAAQ